MHDPRFTNVTVGIKAFIRTDSLKATLQRLVPYSFPRILVVDDAPYDTTKEALYEHFKNRLPLEVVKLPFDTGLAAGRNEIVRRCTTEYLLMLDDDQGIRQDIAKLTEILLQDSKLGGVSCIWSEYGTIRCAACDLFEEGSSIVKDCRTAKQTFGTPDNRYIYFDFIPNSTLFRVDCLREQGWDPQFKIGKEHIDFYLAHKQLNKWHFAVALDVVIDHFPEKNNDIYDEYRKSDDRLSRSLEYFLDKHNLDQVIRRNDFIKPRKELTHKIICQAGRMFQRR